jgi:Uma2 family endonuclease
VSEPAQQRMTSDEFIAWAMEQPETEHYGLCDGEVLPSPPHGIKLSDPVIIVEVLSPSTSASDVGAKLAGYFPRPSLRHYLIARTENRTIAHHARGEKGIILTRIVHDDPIVLDPPGITLTDCFSPGAV